MKKVKCNWCDWEGDENELYLYEIDKYDNVTAYEDNNGNVIRLSSQPDIVEFFKGCPNCQTDASLMDVNFLTKKETK